MSVKAIPNDPMLPRFTDKCRCMECGEYFNSSGTFGYHRVGNWEDRGANRRCLTPAEMESKGWLKNETGHWIRGKRPASASAHPQLGGDQQNPVPEEGSDREPPEPDGECFRGGEADAYLAEQQAWIQRNLK